MIELSPADARNEIERGPSGSSVAAFFDLDGTLVDGFTALAFLQHRFANRDIDAAELGRTVRLGVGGLLGRMGFEEFLEESGKAFKNRPIAEMNEIGREIFDAQIESRIRKGIRALVEAHQKMGHTVVLASSATTFQVEPVANALGIEHVLCNRMNVDAKGRLTGQFIKPLIWGTGKAEAAQAFAAEHEIPLGDSYFYADGSEDVALMHLVGNPRPVHPARHMEAVARRRGWPILREPDADKKTPATSLLDRIGQLRNLAGIAAIAPAAAIGAGVGLMKQDRRAALNTAVPIWLSALLQVNGVEVEITSGEEFLESPRPAVFLFNHKNNWDAFVALYLIGTNVTGVGKKDIADDPIAGPLGRWMDVAFIDREDSTSAVAALKPIEELARKGLSILISPEGTRSPDGTLQPFKKGPFRIAMSAGIPIIPIVIRNAEDLADREAELLRPGKVDVAILPPIPVEDWSLDQLPKHIDAVRSLYVDTLADWPG
jgi:putative phosphoserine phosphatase / 1-acylglycerol-3-phosphate O-acyltransferase